MVSVIFKGNEWLFRFQMIENWITHPGRQWHWDLFNKAEIFARIASHPIFPTIIGGMYLNWNNRRRGEQILLLRPLPIIAEILGRNFQLGSFAVNTVFPGGNAQVKPGCMSKRDLFYGSNVWFTFRSPTSTTLIGTFRISRKIGRESWSPCPTLDFPSS